MEDFEQKNEPKCVQEMQALDKSSFRKQMRNLLNLLMTSWVGMLH
nr:hypothetical protein [uncultured Lachnoanaerobaculum sp.]